MSGTTRVYQTGIMVVTQSDSPRVRVNQTALMVATQNTSPRVRVFQQAIMVLRSTALAPATPPRRTRTGVVTGG
jgi:hypothetical protein